MCSIFGVIDLLENPISGLSKRIETGNKILKHRGPDASNVWIRESGNIGFGHNRLSIIDLSSGHQPMVDKIKNCLVFNGEIYNYLELRSEIGAEKFITLSDTETILKSYEKWGEACLDKFRGMFSFALWDEREKSLFCARDFFGIKPFYYTITDNKFYFASETKALLPFVNEVTIDKEAFKEYLSFQFVLGEKTLFKDIYQLPPGHNLTIKNGNIEIKKYWDLYYNIDYNHTEKYFEEKLQFMLEESLRLHVRSDVPIGGYLSGGLDSSTICSIANSITKSDFIGFTGKFSINQKYDESRYAKLLADDNDFKCEVLNITSNDFINNIKKVIYHLDYPVAGPGSFSQFMISKKAAQSRKVVLGGQGGDEIFGGYTRYLIAYFEQCVKAAINGTLNSGNFIVTYESIIPSLKSLKGYEPMLKNFWKNGLFDSMDRRYFSLINRMPLLTEEVNWESLGDYNPYSTFKSIFYNGNVEKQSYFDLMTHYDFKTLLPALLQVEDRVSMAHGIESRVPLLDRPYVEFSATIPSSIKFENGNMKNIFKKSISKYIPKQILNREDKMGFPTPFSLWAKKDIKEFIVDTLSSQRALQRDLINNKKVIEKLGADGEYERGLWGFLSLELWQQEFCDKANEYKKIIL